MKNRFCYAFEELNEDLPRPPKAALRAMFSAGILVSPRGWKSLSNETRQALATEGTREQINVVMVAELLKEAPPGHIRLVARTADPPVDQVPPAVLKALGPTRSISASEWASLRALDRYVIASLAANTRLLWRALDEFASEPGSKLTKGGGQSWSGALAHCEVHCHPNAIERLTSSKYLDGRAFVLARVAGVRAARRTSEMLDLQVETVSGPAELDWGPTKQPGVLLWQAHVSTWDGEFFPAASLLAVSTAAVALYDMVKEIDPTASIGSAGIVEEPWRVGSAGGFEREESTAVYSAKNNPRLFAGMEPPAPSSSPSPDVGISVPDVRIASVPDSGPRGATTSSDGHGSSSLRGSGDGTDTGDEIVPRKRHRRSGGMSTRAFLVALVVSMVAVAVVSTVVSVVVIRVLMKG